MSDARPMACPVVLDVLLARLQEAGHAVTARTLESWRYKRLIPRPRRVTVSGRTVWAYDERAAAHVTAACELRRRINDLDLIRIHLWLRSFEQDPDDVREAVVAGLRRMDAVVARELSALRSSDTGGEAAPDGEAISALAAALARKRGTSPVPRFIRQSLRDRTKGVEYLLRLSLLQGHDLDASGAQAAEQVLGISRGRRQVMRGVEPWLTGAPFELAAAGEFIGLVPLRTAAETMSASELEEARHVVASFLECLPLATHLLAAMTNDPNPAGFGALRGVASDDSTVVMLVPWAVLALRRSPDGVRTILDALNDMRRQVGPLLTQLTAMSDDDFEQRVATRSAADAARLRRIRRALSPSDTRRTVG